MTFEDRKKEIVRLSDLLFEFYEDLHHNGYSTFLTQEDFQMYHNIIDQLGIKFTKLVGCNPFPDSLPWRDDYICTVDFWEVFKKSSSEFKITFSGWNIILHLKTKRLARINFVAVRRCIELNKYEYRE